MLTSKLPVETGWLQILANTDASRRARCTPGLWMPITTTSLLFSLRSAISWPMRVKARWIAAAFRMGPESAMGRNSKSEIRIPNQARNSKLEERRGATKPQLRISTFEFVSNFEFRISDFGNRGDTAKKEGSRRDSKI